MGVTPSSHAAASSHLQTWLVSWVSHRSPVLAGVLGVGAAVRVLAAPQFTTHRSGPHLGWVQEETGFPQDSMRNGSLGVLLMPPHGSESEGPSLPPGTWLYAQSPRGGGLPLALSPTPSTVSWAGTPSCPSPSRAAPLKAWTSTPTSPSICIPRICRMPAQPWYKGGTRGVCAESGKGVPSPRPLLWA